MARIHVIIASYGGRCGRRHNNVGDIRKENYLQYNLSILNDVDTHIDRITIMKPSIDPRHEILRNYYNFDNINIENIKHKLHIVECKNRGISYGQLLTALYATKDDFDYHIFLEDDYVLFHDLSSLLLVEEYEKQKTENNCELLYLTIGICKNARICHKDRKYTYSQQRLVLNNGNVVYSHIPDLSIGIINKASVNKIFQDHDDNLEVILKKFNNIQILHINQVIFGEILCNSGIKVHDTDDYLSVFWDNQIKTVRFVNLITNYSDIKARVFNLSEAIYKCPLVLPLDILFDPYQVDDQIKQYITEKTLFEERIETIRNIIDSIN